MKKSKLLKERLPLNVINRVLRITNLVFLILIFFISLTLELVPPFNVINIILAVGFIINTIIFAILNKHKPVINTFYIASLGIIFFMLISFLFNSFYGFPRTPILMSLISIFICFWFEMNEENIDNYLKGLLIASWMFILVFIVKEFKGIINPNFTNRIGSSLGNQNDVARHLVFAFIINMYFIYFYATKKKILSIISFLLSLFILFLLLLTGSISNILLSLFLVVAFIIVVAKKKHKAIVISVVVAVIGLSILLLFTIPSLSPIKERILSIISLFLGFESYKPDPSAVERSRAATYGFKLFMESPLFGNGFNSVVNNYKVMAHNNIAEMAADYGIFALMLEELIILLPLYARNKATEKYKAFVVLIGTYVFLVQFVLVVFNSKIESILLPMIFVLSKKPSVVNNFKFKTSNTIGYIEVQI